MGRRLSPCAPNRLLIVDDEAGVREVFKTVLSYGLPDCHVDLAVNGAEAVQVFRDIHHKVILMDLHMPVMDGETAFKEIQQICEIDQMMMPAVVFCTGYAPSDELMESIERNPLHSVLSKPVTNEKLLEVLKQKMAR